MEPTPLHQKQIDRQHQHQFSPVAKGQGKKGTGNHRLAPDQGEVKRPGLPQHGKALCDLPRSAKPKVNPSPSREYWEEGEHHPPWG